MPKSIPAYILFLLAAVCAFTMAATGLNDDKRDVQISILVKGANGTALEGVLVLLLSPDGKRHLVSTDDQGRATKILSLPNGRTAISAELSWEGEGVSELGDREQFAARYLSAIRESHFALDYKIDVPPDVDKLDYEIVGAPCVKVTIRTPQLSPRAKISVMAQGTASQMPPYRSSDLQLLGVKKAAPALLVVSSVAACRVNIIELSAVQTMENVEIADVECPTDDHAVEIDLRVQGAFDRAPDVAGRGVSLIGVDSGRAYVGWSQKGDDGRVVKLNLRVFVVTPGRYAVVPGLLGGDRGPSAVFGYIKTHQKVPPGVDEITVTNEGANQFVIQGVPARDASLALPAYP